MTQYQFLSLQVQPLHYAIKVKLENASNAQLTTNSSKKKMVHANYLR